MSPKTQTTASQFYYLSNTNILPQRVDVNSEV